MISIWTNECVLSLTLVFALVLVSDLEQKVQRSKRDRRNSLHRTQLLESQMKTVRGELVGTLDHLEELRNILRRSQQKSEEREAAMQKLAEGLRWDITSTFSSSRREDLKTPLFIWTICLTAHPEWHNVSHWFTHSCATRCSCNISVG